MQAFGKYWFKTARQSKTLRPVGESPPVQFGTGAMMINIGQVLITVTATEINIYGSDLWWLVKGNICPRGKCKGVYQFFQILFAGPKSGVRQYMMYKSLDVDCGPLPSDCGVNSKSWIEEEFCDSSLLSASLEETWNYEEEKIQLKKLKEDQKVMSYKHK